VSCMTDVSWMDCRQRAPQHIGRIQRTSQARRRRSLAGIRGAVWKHAQLWAAFAWRCSTIMLTVTMNYEGIETTDCGSAFLTTSQVVLAQASVQSFFARPGAPGVHHLHIEARYDPCDTPHETWTDPWRQITAPRLEWLAPALRTARSLRLTLVELMALGYCATHGIATEVLHIDSTWRLHVYDLQWWNRPPCRSLPVSVRRLIMETTCEVGLFTYGFHNYEYAAQCGPKEWGAPELHNLQHLMLRAPQVQIDSLYAFGAQLPERLTLQAKSHINVRGGCAGEVVRKVRQLAANGHRIELCCPTRDCIRSWSEDSPDWNPSEAIKQQEDEHLKELRLWFVETAPDPDPEWCSPHIVRDSYRKPASGICRMG